MLSELDNVKWNLFSSINHLSLTCSLSVAFMNIVNSSSGSSSSLLLYTDDESPIVGRSQRPPRVQFQELCTVASSSDKSVFFFAKGQRSCLTKTIKNLNEFFLKSCNCMVTSKAMLIENAFIYIKISILLINITDFLCSNIKEYSGFIAS